ncbi:hypothetical protein CBR_g36787 [Chara braunii]|uniref:Peptidase S1 domain-containing protein n=1 Tax=Chara braunii TaxID=69332 RepID=A0A388LLN9_CHABU|nr:hypothetical protein CBR_g36787 [Chara braunii]|eukprot:GBG83171.1 hypothetical protein CBR_g36787 [Chara braunii]
MSGYGDSDRSLDSHSVSRNCRRGIKAHDCGMRPVAECNRLRTTGRAILQEDGAAAASILRISSSRARSRKGSAMILLRLPRRLLLLHPLLLLLLLLLGVSLDVCTSFGYGGHDGERGGGAAVRGRVQLNLGLRRRLRQPFVHRDPDRHGDGDGDEARHRHRRADADGDANAVLLLHNRDGSYGDGDDMSRSHQDNGDGVSRNHQDNSDDVSRNHQGHSDYVSRNHQDNSDDVSRNHQDHGDGDGDGVTVNHQDNGDGDGDGDGVSINDEDGEGDGYGGVRSRKDIALSASAVHGGVVGGEERPFQVFILYEFEGDFVPLCGGTLIDPQYVLTASRRLT